MEEFFEIGFAVLAGFALGFGAAVIIWASDRANEIQREPEPDPDKEPPKAQAVRLNASQAGPNVDVRALYPQPGKKPTRSLALVERQAREIVAHCDIENFGNYGFTDSGDEHEGA